MSPGEIGFEGAISPQIAKKPLSPWSYAAVVFQMCYVRPRHDAKSCNGMGFIWVTREKKGGVAVGVGGISGFEIAEGGARLRRGCSGPRVEGGNAEGVGADEEDFWVAEAGC